MYHEFASIATIARALSKYKIGDEVVLTCNVDNVDRYCDHGRYSKGTVMIVKDIEADPHLIWDKVPEDELDTYQAELHSFHYELIDKENPKLPSLTCQANVFRSASESTSNTFKFYKKSILIFSVGMSLLIALNISIALLFMYNDVPAYATTLGMILVCFLTVPFTILGLAHLAMPRIKRKPRRFR